MRNSFAINLKEYVKWVITLILIMIVAWYVSNYYYQLMMIQGNSMYPSYHNMQVVILDKHSNTYTYGEVIAFWCDGLEAVLVKRVVACQGDTVLIENGRLFVNGVESELFGQDTIFDYAGTAKTEVVLQDEQYFVIGDNVAESRDSRYEDVGFVFSENIIGKIK